MPATVLCTNALTGKLAGRTHHCTECSTAITKRCLNKLHVSYCEECGVMFSVMTRGGCKEHQYNMGFNRGVVNERRGKDADFKSDWELEQEAKAKDEEDAEARAEEERRAEDEALRAEYPQKASPKVSNKPKRRKQGKTMNVKTYLRNICKK